MELQKIPVLLKQRGDDPLVLEAIAKSLSAIFRAMQRDASPTNYSVLSPEYGTRWESIVNGTYEYCRGYVEGKNASGHLVVCGLLVCWPEERWGEILPEDLCQTKNR